MTANCPEVLTSHQFVWFQRLSQHPTSAGAVKIITSLYSKSEHSSSEKHYGNCKDSEAEKQDRNLNDQ
jgi:hypothetical protein